MMEAPEKFCRDIFQVGTPLCGIAAGLLGVALAFLLLFLGFWKTLFVVLFFAGGFALGACNHKVEWLKKMINRLFPPKGE